jgi:hypothetical protein
MQHPANPYCNEPMDVIITALTKMQSHPLYCDDYRREVNVNALTIPRFLTMYIPNITSKSRKKQALLNSFVSNPHDDNCSKHGYEFLRKEQISEAYLLKIKEQFIHHLDEAIIKTKTEQDYLQTLIQRRSENEITMTTTESEEHRETQLLQRINCLPEDCVKIISEYLLTPKMRLLLITIPKQQLTQDIESIKVKHLEDIYRALIRRSRKNDFEVIRQVNNKVITYDETNIIYVKQPPPTRNGYSQRIIEIINIYNLICNNLYSQSHRPECESGITLFTSELIFIYKTINLARKPYINKRKTKSLVKPTR